MPDTYFATKDPDAVLDWSFDWSDWLGSDTIATSEWLLPAGITLDSDTNTATGTTAWFSGGTDGAQYPAVNRIVTAGGRTNDRTLVLNVVNQVFTYDLSTAVGQIRLEIGDTSNSTDEGVKPNGTNFTDAELTYFYHQESDNVLGGAARACEVLARMWARAGKSVTIRGYRIDTTKKATDLLEQARELRKQNGTQFTSGSAPVIPVDGYSNDVNSRENAAGGSGEYYGEKKEIRWWP
jgi:hypothetical protein